MKTKITGIITLVLGAFVAVGLHTLFPVCEVTEEMIMQCHWTSNVITGIAAIIAVLGLIQIFVKEEKINIGIGIGNITQSLLLILVPTVLIGVCKGHMNCHTLTEPVIIIVAVVLVLVQIVGLFIYEKTNN